MRRIAIQGQVGSYHDVAAHCYFGEQEDIELICCETFEDVFKEMKADGDQLKGKIYDPESTKTYNGKVSYKAKTDELSVRGSLDKAGLLGRSQIWKRKK